MAELVIQVRRGADWRKVTTIRYETDADGRGAKRREAIRKGLLALADWRASDQFPGLSMRLAERQETRWGEGGWQAITRVGR